MDVFLIGIYVSNDNGITWTQKSEGYPTSVVATSFCFINNFVFVSTDGGIYRRPLSELVGVQSPTNEIPSQYILHQNYPNPFNPNTTITFEVPYQSEISIKLYNFEGRLTRIHRNKIRRHPFITC
jgi:hypothetical protein